MKKTIFKSSLKGFTLVELLVVILILVSLAGLTMAGAGKIQEATKKQKIKSQVKLLENSLQSYHLDYGAYPIATGDGSTGSEALFNCLFNGYDTDGTNPLANGSSTGKLTCYAEYLDPKGEGSSMVESITDSTYYIIDPFKNRFHYKDAESNTDTNNPDFDLWSIGPDGENNDGDNDDIANW